MSPCPRTLQGLQGRLEKLDLASAASDRCSEECGARRYSADQGRRCCDRRRLCPRRSYGVGGAIPSLASGAGGESDRTGVLCFSIAQLASSEAVKTTISAYLFLRKSIHALNGRALSCIGHAVCLFLHEECYPTR